MSKIYYTLNLPVFKQGDDLARYLRQNPENSPKAFADLAEQYEEAAKMCRQVASVLTESVGTEVHADTHHIGLAVSADSQSLLGLVQDQILTEDENDEELEDDEEIGEDEELEDTDEPG